MKNDFRHYCLVSLFSLDEIDAVKLVNNDPVSYTHLTLPTTPYV